MDDMYLSVSGVFSKNTPFLSHTGYNVEMKLQNNVPINLTCFGEQKLEVAWDQYLFLRRERLAIISY